MKAKVLTGLGLLACSALATATMANAGLKADTQVTINAATSKAAACSEKTARKLVNRHDMNAFLLDDPVSLLHCGPFAGPGSSAMVVGVRAATCWETQRWAIFKQKGSRWKLILDRREWVYPLEIVDDTSIRATTPVHGPGDPRCLFSGGNKSRVWSWKEGGFVHSRWEKNRPEFVSPDKSVWCKMDGSNSVTYCNSSDAFHSGWVELGGKTTVCNSKEHCLPNFDSNAPVLDYGRQVELYGFTCSSETDGITCVDDESGKGFRVSQDEAVQVG